MSPGGIRGHRRPPFGEPRLPALADQCPPFPGPSHERILHWPVNCPVGDARMECPVIQQELDWATFHLSSPFPGFTKAVISSLQERTSAAKSIKKTGRETRNVSLTRWGSPYTWSGVECFRLLSRDGIRPGPPDKQSSARRALLSASTTCNVYWGACISSRVWECTVRMACSYPVNASTSALYSDMSVYTCAWAGVPRNSSLHSVPNDRTPSSTQRPCRLNAARPPPLSP